MRSTRAWVAGGVTYESADGAVHHESGEFLEVVEPERLAFTLTQQDGRGAVGPETVVRVEFRERGGATEMHFEQSGYRSVATRDANAEGWTECLDKLAGRLS